MTPAALAPSPNPAHEPKPRTRTRTRTPPTNPSTARSYVHPNQPRASGFELAQPGLTSLLLHTKWSSVGA